MVSDTKIKDAVERNHLITEKEMRFRKTLGIRTLGVAAAALLIYPPSRTAYGLMSLAVNVGIGTWSSGNQSL